MTMMIVENGNNNNVDNTKEAYKWKIDLKIVFFVLLVIFLDTHHIHNG